MPLTPGNWASLLTPGLKEIFDTVVGRPEPVINTLFDVVDSNKSREEYTGIGAIGEVPPFTGSGTVPYADVDQYYNTAIRNFEMALGILVQRSLIDDDQYNVVKSRVVSLADAFADQVEVDAANVFINAFTDSGTNRMGAAIAGADAVGLCSTAHPYSPRASGTTQANEGTLALDLPNLDTTRQAMMNFTDDKGKILNVNPDLLLVPPELERTATQIISERALYEPGSGQFDVNMFAGRIRPVVWNRLTDANAWFLIDSRLAKRFLKYQWRIKPEFAQQEDFDGIVAKYRGYMRYGIGWTHWMWVYGQNPS